MRRPTDLSHWSDARLIRGFSHDLKNPLGAADGNAALLTSGIYGPLSPAQQESVERIRRSIRNALALIDDLNALARTEEQGIPVAFELIDLCTLLGTTGEEYRAMATARGLALRLDLEPDRLTLETDPARVRQIVGNLLSNALKYTSQGAVTVHMRLRKSSGDDEAATDVAIQVIDTGPGIPLDQQARVFDEFVRLGSREEPGVGLGLAISTQLAQAVGGRITVESKLGAGSVFTLLLPLGQRGGPCGPAAPSVSPPRSVGVVT